MGEQNARELNVVTIPLFEYGDLIRKSEQLEFMLDKMSAIEELMEEDAYIRSRDLALVTGIRIEQKERETDEL